jgi:hypothetical protein
VKKKLVELMGQYPLSSQWGLPELTIEKSEVYGLNYTAIGLIVSHVDGIPVYASAAGTDSSSVLYRAYFELLERTSIVEAELSIKTQFSILNVKGDSEDFLKRSQVLKNEDSNQNWKYARSNGVALHSDLLQARSGAYYEILERDAILRSWYSKNSPVNIDYRPFEILNLNLIESTEIRVVQFLQDCPVVGLFGFPKSKLVPLFFGFGAGPNLKYATEHAWNEAIQRLIFTQEGPFPEEIPKCEPTADYHLDYFLYPPSATLIKNWLNCDSKGKNIVSKNRTEFNSGLNSVVYADLTPEHLRNRLWVIKALSETHLPLVFGQWDPEFQETQNEIFVPHPIA